MPVEIKKYEMFDFEINGQSFTGFTVQSEWEGFKLLKNRAGDLIIVASVSGGNISDVFNIITGKDPELKIVKASQNILDAMKGEGDYAG